jgi:hypothetical protein
MALYSLPVPAVDDRGTVRHLALNGKNARAGKERFAPAWPDFAMRVKRFA